MGHKYSEFHLTIQVKTMSINRRVVGVRAQFNFSFRTTNTTNSNMPPKKNSTGSGGGKCSIALSPYEVPESSSLGSLWRKFRGPPDKRLNLSSYFKNIRREMCAQTFVIGQ